MIQSSPRYVYCRWFSSKNKNWEAEEVNSFATIEDFWATMNWTQPASKLGINCDYAVFKVIFLRVWIEFSYFAAIERDQAGLGGQEQQSGGEMDH